MSNIFDFVVAIIAMGAVVGWHELGHWASARSLGFRTPTFSIGFGRPIFSFFWKETLFQIGVFPIGGFVEIPQITRLKESDPQLPAAWKRLIVISAGIVMNLIGAVAIFFVVMVTTGGPAVKIGALSENSPALAAGLKPGDLFEKINGRRVFGYEEVVALVSASPPTVNIVVQRGGERLEKIIRKDAENHIGTSLMLASQQVSPLQAALLSLSSTATSFEMQAKFIASLGGFHTLPPNQHMEVSGPIGITETLSKSLSISPRIFFLILAQINVALAFANLLPIPVLDGGRFILVLVEVFRHRPNPLWFEKPLFYAGAALILGLTLYTTWNDLWRAFF
jgi:regulator of sigma E protease